MPDKKKKKGRASGKAESKMKLRQTTLLGSMASSSPTRPKKSASTPTKLTTPQRANKRHISESSESSDIGAIKLGPVTPANKSDAGSDRSSSPMPSRTKKRRVIVVESGSEEVEVQSSDSEVVPIPRRRRLRRNASAASESEKSDSRPKRRILDKGKSRQIDSDEDENLSEEVDKDRIIESRLRTRDKKTAFQKNLERLRRKKLGKPMSSSESSSEDSEYAVEDQSKPFKGAKPASSEAGSLFSEKEEEEESEGSSDFIVEDDSQAVAAQLPSEFSMRSHDDLSHQFKVIFQFFVHIAVRPAVDRHGFMEDQMKAQDYFAFPLKITRRKLSGLRDSLVASSAWRPKFKKALDKHPTFECVPLDFAVPSCDACHLGGRLSTIVGRLGGVPYDKVGFIDLIESDSDNDSSDNSKTSVTHFEKSEFGFLEFHLGRFCARRVRVYHEFTHWEYNLFSTIRSEIDDLHAAKMKRGFVRVAFPGGKQPPNDLTDADGICDWLDERGFIDQEWHKMKTMIDSAHNLEVSAKKGEED
ncbi:hypothetical protein NP233_g8387 [Leucocoprinus birnbaumii]|uniref:DUF4211 domain-containing protein n=1 Tax=Leucocoprinus birnbaumii TaxID=56174 RepID=A0AAD5VMI6_9AGAR|nr:hypothetical protein NP233_g8387 [Leucocoprinus birnbaumii]